MTDFDFTPRTRIVFGENAADRLGELAREQGARRVLLVTDPGIVEAGHAARAAERLEAESLAVTRFDGVCENPTTATVAACVEAAREADADFLVGLGGGSSLDTAKGANFILSGGGRMEDYRGVGKAKGRMLPLIAVPTTAGTGSECQSFALISHETTHEKMACGDPRAAARVAILDPVLTLTQPTSVAACTGIDALSHAVESAVTLKSTPLSRMFARESFRLSARAFGLVFVEPENLAARGDMLLGASLAGLAIENSMLGAAHAAANPLTARYDISHGQAVGRMLPPVVRYNGQAKDIGGIYLELTLAAGGITGPDVNADEAGDVLATFLERCLETAGMRRSLRDLSVASTDLETLAEDASRQWTGTFNPRPVTPETFLAFYRAVYLD